MSLMNDDGKSEQILKAKGVLYVYFPMDVDYEYEAREFMCNEIPLISMTRTKELVTITLDENVTGKNFVYVSKKIEDLFVALYHHHLYEKLVIKGWFILMGDQGFIVKYEPGDGVNLYKVASINGFLRLDVDTLNMLLDKYVYKTKQF